METIERLNKIYKEMNDKIDIIHMNIPLLIRLFEYFNETNISDEELHFIFERILKLSREKEFLSMIDYNYIINSAE